MMIGLGGIISCALVRLVVHNIFSITDKRTKRNDATVVGAAEERSVFDTRSAGGAIDVQLAACHHRLLVLLPPIYSMTSPNAGSPSQTSPSHTSPSSAVALHPLPSSVESAGQLAPCHCEPSSSSITVCSLPALP